MNSRAIEGARVIVVGAGPVGLTAALALAQADVQVIVIEKREQPNLASRASTFHPPTLDILATLGAATPALTFGNRAARIAFHDLHVGKSCALDLACLRNDTGFPYRLHYEQAKLNVDLMRLLASLPNVQLCLGETAVGAACGSAGAEVNVHAHGRTKTLSGDLVIGADGSHSALRTAAGIGFDGKDYAGRVLRVMTKFDLATVVPGIEPVTYLYSKDASMSLLRMSDCWRMIMRIGPDEADAQFSDKSLIRERIAQFLPCVASKLSIDAFDSYGSSLRIADWYRSGRLVLAGDSAHVTNTRGGMNMNCGLHDAWSLAHHVIQGLRSGHLDEQIDEYAVSRHRVASEKLVPRTDANVEVGRNIVERMSEIADDESKTLDWARSAAMIDMLEIDPRTPIKRWNRSRTRGDSIPDQAGWASG